MASSFYLEELTNELFTSWVNLFIFYACLTFFLPCGTSLSFISAVCYWLICRRQSLCISTQNLAGVKFVIGFLFLNFLERSQGGVYHIFPNYILLFFHSWGLWMTESAILLNKYAPWHLLGDVTSRQAGNHNFFPIPKNVANIVLYCNRGQTYPWMFVRQSFHAFAASAKLSYFVFSLAALHFLLDFFDTYINDYVN